MPVLTAIDVLRNDAFAAAETPLSADDTLTFDRANQQLLTLRNPTGAPITLNIRGAAGSTVLVRGMGYVSVASGYDLTVPANASRAIQLQSISAYLKGVVHLTGGEGLQARLFNFGSKPAGQVLALLYALISGDGEMLINGDGQALYI